jgi:hypothetical protein
VKNPYTTGWKKVARAWDEGYAAGLRAAQELAKEHAYVKWNVSLGEVIEWEQFDREVEAEIARVKESQ